MRLRCIATTVPCNGVDARFPRRRYGITVPAVQPGGGGNIPGAGLPLGAWVPESESRGHRFDRVVNRGQTLGREEAGDAEEQVHARADSPSTAASRERPSLPVWR
jgi:hypothetical protein